MQYRVQIIELAILLFTGSISLLSIGSYLAVFPSLLIILITLLSWSRSLDRDLPPRPSFWGGVYQRLNTYREYGPVIPWLALGMLLPIGASLPKGSLTLSVITCLVLDSLRLYYFQGSVINIDAEVRLERQIINPLELFGPFLLVCLGWVGVAAFYEFPFFYVRDLLESILINPSTVFSIPKIAPVTFNLYEGLISLFLLLMVWGRLTSSPLNRSALLKGVMISWFFALSWVILQAVGITDWPQRRTADFWIKQGRFWGTFSDPNSFGVFSAIFLSLLTSFQMKQSIKYPIVISSVLISLFSGSRSFLMGLFILGIFWLIENKRVFKDGLSVLLANRRLFKRIIVGILVLTIFTTYFKPASLERLFLSINPATSATAFFSRAVFWKSCIWIWSQYPLLGGGLGTFRDNFPQAVQHFGWDLNGWTDNANNFYLGILAELGLVGFLTFCLALVNLRWQEDCQRPLQRAPIFVTLILLFFGPHLEFLEVAVLVALVLGFTARPAKRSSNLSKIGLLNKMIASVGLVAVILSDRIKDYGVFSPPQAPLVQPNLDKNRWIAPKANLVMRCTDGKIKLRITDERPLNLKKTSDDGELVNRVIVSSGDDERVLELFNSAALVEIICKSSYQRVKITSSMPWVPRLNRSGKDARFLGVKVAQLS